MQVGRRFWRLAPAGLVILVLAGAGQSACRANFVGLGQAGQYALLGIDTNFSFNGPGTINGDVALTSGSTYNVASPAIINGTFFHESGVTGSNSGVPISGGIAAVSLAQAITDAQNAAASAAVQLFTGTVPGNVITDGTIFSGGPGQNVLDVTSLTLNNGNFTINGPASATFIINVSGNITVNGGANSSILLSGGVTPDHVLYNVTGTGHNVNFTGAGTLNGTFLDLNGSFSVHDKTLNGALIGGQGLSIADTSGFTINHPFTAVPEPAGFLLLGGPVVVAGLVCVLRLRKVADGSIA
jgi:hypothetical protein